MGLRYLNDCSNLLKQVVKILKLNVNTGQGVIGAEVEVLHFTDANLVVGVEIVVAVLGAEVVVEEEKENQEVEVYQGASLEVHPIDVEEAVLLSKDQNREAVVLQQQRKETRVKVLL